MFGRDRSADNTAQKYSTFVYAEYPVYKKDGWQVDAGVGGAFALNRAGDDHHFYGTTPGIVHTQLKVSRPDFVTFLRHVCKCLIIKGSSRCFG